MVVGRPLAPTPEISAAAVAFEPAIGRPLVKRTMQFIDSTGKLVDKDKLPREFDLFTNREPSLFAVAKLLATHLVNLNRVEVLWRPVTNHLLEVIIHPLNRLRGWGIDVITTLVRSVIQCDYSTPLKENQRLQTLFISPLNELSSTSFADVQQKQVDCVLHLLHSSGDIISFGWPLFHNIVGAINNSQGKLSLK
ncbi:hypothetical protein OUZ56_001572 [Daphnia magna]|uniref:Mon2/Sec7/BIG1-like HDS domain-containing protein n=1 Tax=Daphnia magna TaxID=35525 RepID=A0ABR0A333_9CRUS|nr:hypothetical protein OUZ56_001572 [Daphnia magna]